MGFFKEFFNRKKMEIEVLEIVHQFLTEETIEKYSKDQQKKAQKKFEKAISSMRFKLKDYKTTNKLGVYGTSKLLKVVQDEMLKLGLEGELVKSVVKKIMM